MSLKNILGKKTLLSEFRMIKDYWQVLSIFGTVIFFCVYMYLENKSSREEVKILIETNKELKSKINHLDGEMEIINKTISVFLENNPQTINYRLEKIEEEFSKNKPINNQILKHSVTIVGPTVSSKIVEPQNESKLKGLFKKKQK